MAKRRGYHLLYSLALLSLLALAVWWSVFIERAITNQREFHVQLFEIRTTIIARSLGQDENPPQLGGASRFSPVRNNQYPRQRARRFFGCRSPPLERFCRTSLAI